MQKKKTEELVIVGGGLEGMLAALFASRVKLESGQPRYKITLIEANEHLAKGASEAFFRLHLGGEYPLDPQTGKDCLWGAALWKLLLPQKKIYTENGETRFLLAKETEEDAKNGVKGKLSVGQFFPYYKNEIVDEYRNLIQHIHKKKQGSTEENIAEELFGPVDNFMRVLDTRDELEYYKDHVSCGFASREPGLYLPRLLAALEHAVRTRKNIKVITQSPVTEVKPTENEGFDVCCAGKKYHANQVIQAAWAGGFALDGPLRTEGHHKEVKVYRRAMAVVDISGIPKKEMPPPSFVLKDEDGGMFCPINERCAVVYHPKEAHLEEVELNSADPARRSPKWKKVFGEGEKKSKLEAYKESVMQVFPFLKEAKFSDLIVQPTLNFQKSIDQRRHEPCEEIRPGYHAIYATKGTLAVRSAIEAVEAVRKRSKMPKHGEKGYTEKLISSPENPAKALDCALDDMKTYRIYPLLHFKDPDIYRQWLERRGGAATALWAENVLELPDSTIQAPSVQEGQRTRRKKQ